MKEDGCVARRVSSTGVYRLDWDRDENEGRMRKRLRRVGSPEGRSGRVPAEPFRRPSTGRTRVPHPRPLPDRCPTEIDEGKRDPACLPARTVYSFRHRLVLVDIVLRM